MIILLEVNMEEKQFKDMNKKRRKLWGLLIIIIIFFILIGITANKIVFEDNKRRTIIYYG